ncbi:MAG: hypothetical protein AMXMBFR84_14110 [Candidatus Hydrogenedentota bacterium]
MKRLLSIAATGGLIVLAGCAEGTPGGPGVTEEASAPAPTYDPMTPPQIAMNQTEQTFTLDTPMLGASVTQGESSEVPIGVQRGSEMNQTVTVEFDGVPAGVTITPESPTLIPGQGETNVTISASPTAPAGEYTVSVKGRPETGAVAETQMDITVEERPEPGSEVTPSEPPATPAL